MTEKTPEQREKENKVWEEKIKRIPLNTPIPDTWPDDVRIISFKELENFGIDRNHKIYWNGRAVVTETKIKLSPFLSFLAVLVNIFGIFSGLVSVQTWACSMDYWTYCPKNTNNFD